ncbi:FAD binding domain-containing protein [Fusobacterium sp.]|uniref:FAD binding domain-containing protein n=1 Tax=Fusobacterium sp. TaxID=68766 RepID=UPI0026261210|nr:FAD binding domain-containing protein [Fusobacterium sp.]
MFTFKNFFVASTIEEAYDELIKNKKNVLLGGTSYLRMGNTNYNTAIDISNVSEIDKIIEKEDSFEIGAMVSFREIETNELLFNYFPVLSHAVEDIVGVQLRNNVRVGATVFTKHGFSDLITALLCLDSYVVLYKGGVLKLEEFLKEKQTRKDILTKIIIKKEKLKSSFQCVRKSKADYSILNLAISKNEKGEVRISVGARPGKAVLAYETMEHISKGFDKKAASEIIRRELIFDTNMRGSKEYRELLSMALLEKALMEVE